MALRLGVLGGTFDPIHYGHLMAAEVARSTLLLDRILFAPVESPPHKRGNEISPTSHRLKMISLAIAENPGFSLSLVDIERPVPQYSVDTVRLLREEWGTDADNTFFIIGGDSLEQMLTWYQPEALIRQCRLAVVPRPDFGPDLAELERALPGLSQRVSWVDMPVVGISATDLRRRVRARQSIRYQTPECVAHYIAAHQLYGEH
jgi:nicotinate-nucleotide adenylyltransferase